MTGLPGVLRASIIRATPRLRWRFAFWVVYSLLITTPNWLARPVFGGGLGVIEFAMALHVGPALVSGLLLTWFAAPPRDPRCHSPAAAAWTEAILGRFLLLVFFPADLTVRMLWGGLVCAVFAIAEEWLLGSTFASYAVAIALGAGVAEATLTAFLYRLHPQEVNLRSRYCVACGYDLRASEDRCPECGEAMATAVIGDDGGDQARQAS